MNENEKHVHYIYYYILLFYLFFCFFFMFHSISNCKMYLEHDMKILSLIRNICQQITFKTLETYTFCLLNYHRSLELCQLLILELQFLRQILLKT